jgi:hypothetical protein
MAVPRQNATNPEDTEIYIFVGVCTVNGDITDYEDIMAPKAMVNFKVANSVDSVGQAENIVSTIKRHMTTCLKEENCESSTSVPFYEHTGSYITIVRRRTIGHFDQDSTPERSEFDACEDEFDFIDKTIESEPELTD